MIWLLAAANCWAQPQAAWDWSDDARWSLKKQGQTESGYYVGQPLVDFSVEDPEQDMVMLPMGLLLRHRHRMAVNLTVLEGVWDLQRNDQSVGQVGGALANWLQNLGTPRQIYRNPAKLAEVYYYQSSMVDIGLMVAEQKVHSVMLVEPGYLLPALEATGYSAAP